MSPHPPIRPKWPHVVGSCLSKAALNLITTSGHIIVLTVQHPDNSPYGSTDSFFFFFFFALLCSLTLCNFSFTHTPSSSSSHSPAPSRPLRPLPLLGVTHSFPLIHLASWVTLHHTTPRNTLRAPRPFPPHTPFHPLARSHSLISLRLASRLSYPQRWTEDASTSLQLYPQKFEQLRDYSNGRSTCLSGPSQLP